MPPNKFWIHDKTRMCSMTTGQEEAAANLKEGFREVTAEEQDAFREETKALKATKQSKKGKKADKSSGLVVDASAADLAKIVADFNK